MEQSKACPFYQRLSFNLISLALLCTGLVLGKLIILPILFAILLANFLLPATRKLEGKNIYKPATILLPLIGSTILIAALVFLISSQVVNFLDDLPALSERWNTLSASAQKWIRSNAHITIQKQNQYLTQGVENLKEQVPNLLTTTLSSLFGMANYFFLIPIYTFLILFYRTRIKEFLIGVFRNGSEDKVREVLTESTNVAQHYMLGLLIETATVFTMNLIGFFIIGIKYKVLLALLAALLNLIPYLGMLTANVLCMLSVLVTSNDPKDVIWVGVALALVQIIDNNIGMPMIVGSKVRINAMVTIIGVIIGGSLCGVPGMFLAIPGLAVLKIIFDKVPELNPWGVLLGEENGKKKKLALVKQKTKVNNKVTV